MTTRRIQVHLIVLREEQEVVPAMGAARNRASEPQRHVSEHLNPDCRLGHATHRENSDGASHATAIRNAPPADGCSTRKTSPAASNGRATGKRRVTSIFARRGISVSHRSRRPWALTFCAAVSTSPVFSPLESHEGWLPNRVSTLTPALLTEHWVVLRQQRYMRCGL